MIEEIIQIFRTNKKGKYDVGEFDLAPLVDLCGEACGMNRVYLLAPGVFIYSTCVCWKDPCECVSIAVSGYTCLLSSRYIITKYTRSCLNITL